MQRLLGFGWAFGGLLLIFLGLVIGLTVNTLIDMIPPDVVVVLPEIPAYAGVMLGVVGVGMVAFGAKLAAHAPGTRVVGAFLHSVLGLALVIAAYILWAANISFISTRTQYILVAIVAFLGVISWVTAWQLFTAAPIHETGAGAWTPFPVCPRCGRKLDAEKQCPWHDRLRVFPRFIDRETNKVFPITIPDGQHVVIGTGNVPVYFDPAERAEYATISHEHAQIEYDAAGRFRLKNGQNRNGTFISEVEVMRSRDGEELTPGSIVRFGAASFVFEVVQVSQDQLDATDLEVLYA